MKKVFKVLLVLIVALMPFVAVSAKTTKTTTTTAAKIEGNKVNFYVFHGNGCTHCADLLSFLSELDKDPEYNYMYDLVKYEVWYNQENATLMTSVFKYFGVTDENKMGVPLYVIGDQHFSGFPNPTSQAEAYKKATDDIKAALKKAYTDANYKDIVAGIGSGSIDPDESKANENSSKDTNNIIGYVIIGLVVIVIIAIIFGRHNSDVYYPTEEEDDEEETTEEPKKEVVEEKVVAKKVAVKKPAAKKTTAKTTAKKTTKTTSTKKTAAKKNTKKK